MLRQPELVRRRLAAARGERGHRAPRRLVLGASEAPDGDRRRCCEDLTGSGHNTRSPAAIAPTSPICVRTVNAAHASSATPSGALNLRPHGMFFSIAMTAPSASIQPML